VLHSPRKLKNAEKILKNAKMKKYSITKSIAYEI